MGYMKTLLFKKIQKLIVVNCYYEYLDIWIFSIPEDPQNFFLFFDGLEPESTVPIPSKGHLLWNSSAMVSGHSDPGHFR